MLSIRRHLMRRLRGADGHGGLFVAGAFTLPYRNAAIVGSPMQPECGAVVVACRVVCALARTLSACVWLARYVNDHMLTRQRWLWAILARNHSLYHKTISLQTCPTCQRCVMRLQRLRDWAVEVLENPFNQCH